MGGILVIKRFCHRDSEFDDSLDTSVAWPEQPVPRRCALILFRRRNREHGEGIAIVYQLFWHGCNACDDGKIWSINEITEKWFHMSIKQLQAVMFFAACAALQSKLSGGQPFAVIPQPVGPPLPRTSAKPEQLVIGTLQDFLNFEPRNAAATCA